MKADSVSLFGTTITMVFSLFLSIAEAKDVLWDAATQPVIVKPISLAADEALVLRGTNANLRIEAPIVGDQATLRGALGKPGSVNNKAVLAAPVKVKDVQWGWHYAQAYLEIESTGNSWGRFELAYARVVCKGPNVLAPEGALSWGRYYRGDGDNCATFDLGGFDQVIDRLDSTSSPNGKNSDRLVSSGGTLTLRGSTDATCLARVDGGVSLVWEPKGDYCQAFDERENGTTGKLVVRRGTLRVGGRSAFRRVSEVEVGAGAVFDCQSVLTQALASVKTVVLKKDARLRVSGADPFPAYATTIVCHPGARVESRVQLALKCQVAADTTPPQNVGDKLQVFWDDQIVNRAETTATRTPHHPEYAGKVMTFDRPWEGNFGCYASVVKVGDVWRMYRQSTSNCEVLPFYRGPRFGLLESHDGITWERAKVNRYSVYGENENNIVLDGDVNFWDNFMVFEDTNPACPPSERFKAISLFDHKWSEAYAKKHPAYDRVAKEGKALWCFLSSDGLEFRPGWKLFNHGDHGLGFDSLNVAFWDPSKKIYRLYMRSIKPITGNRFGERNARWVMVSESPDFKTWTKPVSIDFKDGIDDYQLYTSGVDQYPRNPELIVGFPTRYTERKQWSDNYEKLCDADRRRERRGADSRHGLAITDSIFMWSRDGRTFEREEDAFLTPGPEHARNWNYGNCYLQRGFVITPGRRGEDDELSFFLPVGCWSDSPLELDRYVLRMDGFVSYHGRYRTEKLVTKRLVFSGDELLVNFATSPGGHMFVTIRDEEGKALRSCELFGDKVDRPIGFENGSLADFAGKPVMLEFELSDADVYSFRFHKASAHESRPIDGADLAARASEYAQRLESAGVSNVMDAVRVPWLGALNMRYRATGDMEVLKSAQALFAVMQDAKRPLAEDLMRDDATCDRWLSVVDAHFRISKNPWPVRAICCESRRTTPLALHYRWKYRHHKASKEALYKLDLEQRVGLPTELERYADRLAYRAVGATSSAAVATKLVAEDPTDLKACAEWLWAYWTARYDKEGKK